MNSKVSQVIAIDGPSGSGKSTVARALAEQLEVLYIDTGAMYRALAYSCDQAGVPFEEGEALTEFLNDLEMHYGRTPDCLVEVNGENLTAKIREHQVSKLASIISQIPSVRKFLLGFQRRLANKVVCVMEGRDIGTVVFPDAFCKFFITASEQVRAKRRLDQLHRAGETQVSLEQVIEDVQKRDDSDINRAVAPLKQADDADYLDTSELELDAVVKDLSERVRNKAREVGIEL